MRGVVANELQSAWILARDDLDLARSADRVGEVAHGAVERVGDGLLRQRFGDGFGEPGAGRRSLVGADGTIGECEGNLGHHRLLSSPANERGWVLRPDWIREAGLIEGVFRLVK